MSSSAWNQYRRSGQHKPGSSPAISLRRLRRQRHADPSRAAVVEDAAEDTDAAVFLGIEEHFFAAGSAAVDVDGGPDTSVDEFTVEDDFLVAGALEFFEDYFVHAATGVDERGSDDGEGSAFFDFSC